MIQSINYIVYVQFLCDIKGFVSNITNVKTLLPRKSIKGKEYQFNSLIEPNVNLNTPSQFAIFAKLIVPAFTRGKKQLSSKEVGKSRMMYRARIQFERVIGRLKNFEIIKGTLPINLVKRKVDSGITSGGKLVRVVTAIINTIVPIL